MDVLCQIVFWLAAVGISYSYVGYGLLVAVLARTRAQPIARGDIEPTVTVLIAAYNEAACIESKLTNTLALDYAPTKLRIAVAADGSSDETCDIVRRVAAPHPNVTLYHEPERRGKPAAVNRVFPLTESDIVLFTDANTFLPADTLKRLIPPFADPAVGATSGSKRMIASSATTAEQGEGIYWRYESFLKECDSAISSVMGVPGEIWAARREAYLPPYDDSVIDDFVASMRMVAAGWRVVFDPKAVASEEASPNLRAEWVRRTRMAAGGWQSFFQLRSAMRNATALVNWQYISHRMLRWMVTPSLFVVLLVANLCLLPRPFYLAIACAQAVFYLAALAGWLLTQKGRRIRWLLAPFYIIMLNAAALVGGWRYLRGTQSVIWKKAR